MSEDQPKGTPRGVWLTGNLTPPGAAAWPRGWGGGSRRNGRRRMKLAAKKLKSRKKEASGPRCSLPLSVHRGKTQRRKNEAVPLSSPARYLRPSTDIFTGVVGEEKVFEKPGPGATRMQIFLDPQSHFQRFRFTRTWSCVSHRIPPEQATAMLASRIAFPHASNDARRSASR